VAIVAPSVETAEGETGLMSFLLQHRIIFVGRVINDVVRRKSRRTGRRGRSGGEREQRGVVAG